MNVTITADAVAWYAAIVATGSAVVSSYNVWRDRTRLRVTATPNIKIAESSADYSKDNTYIMIEVANTGRRPVHLQTLPWFTVKGQKKDVYAVTEPWQPTDRLAEGESARMLCNQDTLDIEFGKLDSVVVRDATNRKWKGSVGKGE